MKIIDSIEKPRKLLLKSITKQNTTSNSIKVLVIGGGPVGLISAIEAYKKGEIHIIVIIETLRLSALCNVITSKDENFERNYLGEFQYQLKVTL